MVKSIIKDIVFLAAVIFFFMFFLPIWGSEFTLLEKITLNRPDVFFSDLVKEPVPSDLDKRIAYAQKGDVLFLNAGEILRRLGRKVELKGRGVYVYRASRLLMADELRQIIANLLPEGWKISGSLSSVLAPVNADFSVKFSDECLAGSCFVDLYAHLQGQDVDMKLISFKVERFNVRFWRLCRDVKKGDVISRADVELAPLKKGYMREFLSQDESPVGLTARRFLPKGSFIEKGFVEKRYIVRKGAIVDVKLRSNGIVLSSRAVALENGSVGDWIELENPSSHRVFFAEVVGKNELEVEL